MPILLIAIYLLLTGCTSAVVSGANAAYDNYSIKRSFENQKLGFIAEKEIERDPMFKPGDNIHVALFNYNALAYGQVHDEAFKNKITSILDKYADIKKVYNFLEVGPRVSGEQRVQDSWTTTKIKSQIVASSTVEPNKVKIITENNTAFLMAVVTPEQGKTIVDIARDTAGVDRVVKIFSYVYYSDKEIERSKK